MVEKVTLFKASDGKTFKTQKGAENHNKKVESKETMERLGMTKDEVTESLKKVAPYNMTIRGLLKMDSDWQKWPPRLIARINERILAMPDKKTIYVRKYRSYGDNLEDVIATEEGEEFTNPELHLENDGKEYKLVDTQEVDEYTLKVLYDYKYTWEERIAIKLNNGERISESEISTMVYELDEVYQEEGDEGRWERHMTTVVDLLGDHYAIDWSRGLTESQENGFHEQPYKVKVEEKEITVTKTIITPID